MAVASYLSNVTVLDIQSKKSIFKQMRAHNDSPCVDVCWSPTDPNQLISVGYDCKLNVYDLRQKPILHQIKDLSPFNSVAVSPCGMFCCTGSLRGGLCAYDLRSLRANLATRKDVHSGPVVRVAFTMADKSPAVDDTVSALRDASRASDARYANLLGNGSRCSVVGRPSTMLRMSMAPEARPSMVGRPSMAAVTSGYDERDAAHDSFNAFLSKCTRAPEMLMSRNDSMLDMEVRPVRFADVSDSDLSSAGPSSRRNSLMGPTGLMVST